MLVKGAIVPLHIYIFFLTERGEDEVMAIVFLIISLFFRMIKLFTLCCTCWFLWEKSFDGKMNKISGMMEGMEYAAGMWYGY